MYEVYVLVEKRKGLLANLLMLVSIFITIFKHKETAPRCVEVLSLVQL